LVTVLLIFILLTKWMGDEDADDACASHLGRSSTMWSDFAVSIIAAMMLCLPRSSSMIISLPG
jgi:hypothetical protein